MRTTADMRKKLTTELASLPQYDELIGDIRLLRFLRETHLKVDQVRLFIRALKLCVIYDGRRMIRR